VTEPLLLGSAVVVLADSDPQRRRAVAAALERAGHQTIEAASAAEAVEGCRVTDPDLLLIDVDLEEGAGAGVIDRVRSSRPLSRIPIISYSTDASTERVVDCLRRGAQDHIRTPLDTTEVLARIEAVLRTADENERLRRHNDELEYLGSMDTLTGLFNRRQIEEELSRLSASAARHHQPLAAVLFAVDRWPEHESAGATRTDAVLKEIAVLISAIARTGDVTARIADHEFAVLLPMTTGDGARIFAERIRTVVAAAPIVTDAGPVAVSVAAGCATGAPGPTELLDRARQALGRAVAAGGDTLVSIFA
jgi:two-component system cell cycle response regulator